VTLRYPTKNPRDLTVYKNTAPLFKVVLRNTCILEHLNRIGNILDTFS